MGNKEFVASLVASKVLATPRVIEAFLETDRIEFVPAGSKASAYDDRPLPLAVGATISQPSTVAIMLELLQPAEGDDVLDIGSGSGWTTAILSRCVGQNGSVTGTEIIPELVAFGQTNLANLNITNALVLPATDEPGMPGRQFDKILVSAAASSIPDTLVSQLPIGGVMVIPVGHSVCKVTRVTEEDIETETYPGFVFVPLR